MKKGENRKNLFRHIQVDLKGIWNNFFCCDNSKSKIVASVHCAYASKDKMKRIWLKKKKKFISAPKSATYIPIMTW